MLSRYLSPSAFPAQLIILTLVLLTEGELRYIASVTERSMSKPSDFVQGTLDILLLEILALEPLHGWAISQRLTAMFSR